MEILNRIIELSSLCNERSVFLFGPRQTGKSSLIKQQLPHAKQFNLLKSEVFLALSASPHSIREALQPGDLVVIDEIQRIPELLNEVHYLIEERKIRFLMTGSSARNLRRVGTNLLGGRARRISFHPFSKMELGERFSLSQALNNGLLPPIAMSDNPEELLSSYVNDYLQQEIVAEGAARNIPAFSRFLMTASHCNAQLINFSNIANDAQVSPTTVREYFSILEESLIASRLEVWRESKRRKATSTAKFYFFDTGVVRFLQGRKDIPVGSPEYGFALETYIHHELRCFIDYHSREPLTFWHSVAGEEVDFLIGERLAIEVKSTNHVAPKLLSGLKALREEGKFKHFILVANEPFSRIVDGIEIVPISDFVERLWKGDWA